MRHPDDCFARAMCSGELDREVEHRHGHVETFDREALLAQVRLVQEALERVDDGETRQQLLLPFSREWAAVLTRFDHLSQPHPLLVTADVLDLVRDRAAVGRAQLRQRLGERAAWDVDAQHVGRNPGHNFGRESQAANIEGWIARRLAAQRIEMRGEVAEVAMRSDERVGGGDVFEVVEIRSREHGARSNGSWRRSWRRRWR